MTPMATFKEFCDGVLKEMPRATTGERADIREELTDHLMEHRDMLVEHGVEVLEAERRAIEAMGDPVEIGKAWNEKLSPFWLLLGRVCLVLFVVILWSNLSSIQYKVDRIFKSLDVRYSEDAGTVFREMEGCDLLWMEDPGIKKPFGEHIIRIHRVELWQDRTWDEYILKINYVSYHQDLLGYALGMHVWDALKYEGGEPDGGGGSHIAYATWTSDKLQVEPGQESVSVTMDYNGNHFEADIEIDWGGAAA